MCARLTQALTQTLHVANPEATPNQSIQVDSARDDVATCLGVAEPSAPRQFQSVQHLRLDQGQVIAPTSLTGWSEGSRLGRVPVAVKPPSSKGQSLVHEPNGAGRHLSKCDGLDSS